MKRILLILLLISQSAFAIPHNSMISIDFLFCENNSFKTTSIEVAGREPWKPATDFYKPNYAYEFVNKEDKVVFNEGIYVDFWAFDFGPTRCVPGTIEDYFEENFSKFRFYNGSELIFEQELPAFCNNDGVCASPENYYSCNDCLSGSADNICDYEDDNVCDPDCVKFNIDPDCPKIPVVGQPTPVIEGNPADTGDNGVGLMWIGVLLVPLTILALAVHYIVYNKGK